MKLVGMHILQIYAPAARHKCYFFGMAPIHRSRLNAFEKPKRFAMAGSGTHIYLYLGRYAMTPHASNTHP